MKCKISKQNKQKQTNKKHKQNKNPFVPLINRSLKFNNKKILNMSKENIYYQ